MALPFTSFPKPRQAAHQRNRFTFDSDLPAYQPPDAQETFFDQNLLKKMTPTARAHLFRHEALVAIMLDAWREERVSRLKSGSPMAAPARCSRNDPDGVYTALRDGVQKVFENLGSFCKSGESDDCMPVGTEMTTVEYEFDWKIYCEALLEKYGTPSGGATDLRAKSSHSPTGSAVANVRKPTETSLRRSAVF